MKSTNQLTSQLVSELFVKQIIDPSAETASDIVEKTGQSKWKVKAMVADWLKLGKVERVFKKQSGKLVPAYRIIK